MGEIEKLMSDREPGDMPSPQDFHTAFDADIKQEGGGELRWMVSMTIAGLLASGLIGWLIER